MWCVIPVAGRGTRLEPLTRGQPKALLKIRGRAIIDRLLERVAPAVTDVCLVTDGRETPIRDVLGEARYGVRLHYVVQPEPLGVADAVFKARDTVTGTFLVVMGDCYYEEYLDPYVGAWRRSRARGAVLVEPLNEPPNDSLGLVHLQGDRVVTIAKSPIEGQGEFRVCGLMVLPESAFEVFQEIRPGATGELELEDVVARLIQRGVEFLALRYRGWRRNINTRGDLLCVERRLGSHAQG